MIVYEKLFEMIKSRGLQEQILQLHFLGPTTLVHLKKGYAGLSRSDLDELCKLLSCQPGDLMEYIED